MQKGTQLGLVLWATQKNPWKCYRRSHPGGKDVKNYCDFYANQLVVEQHRRLQKHFVFSCLWTAAGVWGTRTRSGCLQPAWLMLTIMYELPCPKGWSPLTRSSRRPLHSLQGLKQVLQAREMSVTPLKPF